MVATRFSFPQILWLTALYSGFLHGQADLATVTGVVGDSEHAVMPGVSVTKRNTGTNIARSMLTNEVGYFTIPNLPPGEYELTSSKPGFSTYRKSGIVLETG